MGEGCGILVVGEGKRWELEHTDFEQDSHCLLQLLCEVTEYSFLQL